MITWERLGELLDYNPETGVFRWKKLSHESVSNISVGDVAGWVENNGYRRITIDGQRYVAHRLAWFYMKGEMPKGKLDHKDGNRDYSAIANLRIATPRQNSANRKCHANNLVGLKGVQIHKQTGKYRARIFINGKHVSLGLHDTPDDAARAYAVAARDAFGEFARVA